MLAQTPDFPFPTSDSAGEATRSYLRGIEPAQGETTERERESDLTVDSFELSPKSKSYELGEGKHTVDLKKNNVKIGELVFDFDTPATVDVVELPDLGINERTTKPSVTFYPSLIIDLKTIMKAVLPSKAGESTTLEDNEKEYEVGVSRGITKLDSFFDIHTRIEIRITPQQQKNAENALNRYYYDPSQRVWIYPNGETHETARVPIWQQYQIIIGTEAQTQSFFDVQPIAPPTPSSDHKVIEWEVLQPREAASKLEAGDGIIMKNENGAIIHESTLPLTSSGARLEVPTEDRDEPIELRVYTPNFVDGNDPFVLQPSTAEGIFEDGFETGDTSNWARRVD